MLDFHVYKIIHIAGLALVLLGLGAGALGAREDGRAPRGAGLVHGAGLIVMVVGGFGMMARHGIAFPWPAWLFCKMGVWVAIGAVPALVKRGVVRGTGAVLLAVTLVGVAAGLAIYKPFV